jgi:Protein of unknown function (DUF1592)
MRASMAVRGIRPSLDELAQVEADPGALPALVDSWLESDEFGDMIEDLHAELFLLRDDTQYQLPVMGSLITAGYNQADLHQSTVAAPLKLVREVVTEDRPYGDILTADYTVANQVVADIYGLEFDPAGEEWQHTHWVDGRPQSGLLSDSQIWRRHVSNAANFHRGRANFVSRTFLCEDLGARDVFVAGGIDIADPLAVANAVSDPNQGCVGCHTVLDPLAAFFWGYKEQLQRGAILSAYDLNCEYNFENGPPPMGDYRVEHWCYPLKFYDVAEEDDWEYWGLRPPGLYGKPGETVEDLGLMILDDPRFGSCTAKNVAAYLTETDRKVLPDDWVIRLTDVLTASNYSVKALVKEIVLSQEFSTARVLNAGDPPPFTAGLQVVRPEQLARMINDLTGFRWMANEDTPACAGTGNNCWGNVDLLTSDVYGFRSMMGGIDSFTVTHPTHTPTPTKLLALSKLADEAAGYVVYQDFLKPAAERKLLTGIESAEVDEAKVRAQIASLAVRILGQRWEVDGIDTTGMYALFTAATERTSQPTEGWKVVVSAFLRDPLLVFY